MQHKPSSIVSWLLFFDGNYLSEDQAKLMGHLDPDNPADLRQIIVEWIRPDFDESNDVTRMSMIEILEQSKHWAAKDLRPTFADIGLPHIDIDRVMKALRDEFLK